MAKRIVDGEAIWTSQKIRKLSEEFRPHYATWLPLAEANGVFEADPLIIWSRIYSVMLPSFTKDKVQEMLRQLKDVGLLVIWEECGKTWAYFVGIDKPGRLPAKMHQGRYKTLPPDPPKTPSSRNVPDTPGICPEGVGVGSGIGIGNTLSSPVPEAGESALLKFGAKADYVFSKTEIADRQRHKNTEIVQQVFDHYLAAVGANPKLYKLSDKRRNTALKRLDECRAIFKGRSDLTPGDVDDRCLQLMKSAIDKLSASDFHMNRGPSAKGKKFCDWIDHLFKNYETMEKWWNQQ